MTYVQRGYCPDCGKDELFAGAVHYSDTGLRVVPCLCGSHKPLVATKPVKA